MSLRSRWEDAFSRAGGALDRGGLRLMRHAMARQDAWRPPATNARERLTRIAAHYHDGHQALFAAPATAELSVAHEAPRSGAAALFDLSWPSRYRATFPGYVEELARYGANTTARARLYQSDVAPAGRPTIVCLHGLGQGRGWIDERAFGVAALLELGFDVALLELPFHGRRAPVQAPRSGSLFLSSHLVRTNEAFGQAVFDARALAGALRARGATSVGVLGMSLGSYLAAVWATLEPELAFASAVLPAVSMSALLWSHGAGIPVRKRAERSGVSEDLLAEVFAVHAPLSRPVLLPRERLFIAAASGDRITPPEQAEALWRHWGQPELVWMAGGHLAQGTRGRAFRALGRWLYSLELGGRSPSNR